MTRFERNFCHGHEGFRPLGHQASSGLCMTQIEIARLSRKLRRLSNDKCDNNDSDTKHSKPYHTTGDDVNPTSRQDAQQPK